MSCFACLLIIILLYVVCKYVELCWEYDDYRKEVQHELELCDSDLVAYYKIKKERTVKPSPVN